MCCSQRGRDSARGGGEKDVRLTSVQIIWNVGHALHPATDHHVTIAQHDALRAEDERLHARGAHLVDGGARRRKGDATFQRSLTSGSLAHRSLQDVAEEHLVHRVARNLGILERRPNGTTAQVGGLQA